MESKFDINDSSDRSDGEHPLPVVQKNPVVQKLTFSYEYEHKNPENKGVECDQLSEMDESSHSSDYNSSDKSDGNTKYLVAQKNPVVHRLTVIDPSEGRDKEVHKIDLSQYSSNVDTYYSDSNSNDSSDRFDDKCDSPVAPKNPVLQKFTVLYPVVDKNPGNPDIESDQLSMLHSSDSDSNESSDRANGNLKYPVARKNSAVEGITVRNISEKNTNDEQEIDYSLLFETDISDRLPEVAKPTCEICFKSFATKASLKNHYETHTGNRPHVCKVCRRGFVEKKNLKAHYFQHTGERPHKCGQCGKGFIKKTTLRLHYAMHAGMKYVCEQCGKAYISKVNLDRHRQTHSSEKSYVCDLCNKAFHQKYGMQQHRLIHSEGRPHICDVCGKGFLSTFNLKSHMYQHTKEKPFVCDLCGKAFTKKHSLKVHYKHHTGEIPYVCELCNQSFWLKRTLTSHYNKHTGEVPYACGMCGKKFTTKHGLKQHYNSQKHIEKTAEFLNSK